MRRILLFTFLLLSTLLVAQKAPMKWGKVAQEHLDMTVYEADSSASAVVLCDYGTTNFQIAAVVEVNFFRHVRIKLLDQAAVDRYGDIVITHSADEPVTGLKANVIMPDGDVNSISKREWFREKVSDDVYKEKLSLPGLKPGAIIEYKYLLTKRSWTSIPSWKFQRDIPVMHSELRVDMPDWFIYVEMLNGGDKVDIATRRHSEVMGAYSIDLEMKTFVAKDVPALKREPYVSTMDDYLYGIRFQLKEFRPTSAPWEKIMTSWNDITKILIGDTFFGGQYLRNGKGKRMIDAAQSSLADLSSNKEIAIAIYDFINNRVKTEDGGHPFYASKSISDAFKSGLGTVAEKI